MHRFYLPPVECNSIPLMLTGREAHHALRVLRLRPGDRVTVLNGAGIEFICDVETHDRDKVQLAVVGQKSIAPPPCHITLLQAIPKAKIMDSIIQKATELGVARIVPLLAERVVSDLDEKHSERKTEKWRQVALEALKQCGTAWLPQVETPVTPAEFAARKEKFDLPLLASLQRGARHPRLCFEEFQSQYGRKPETASIWVGPEGDFTPAEVEVAMTSGALPITLGKLVLRVETAAVYCLSILNYEIQSPTQRD